MRGMIVVIPTAGLANRMRIMASSFKLARETNKKIHVYWGTDEGLNADYDNLFTEHEELPVKKLALTYRIWAYLNDQHPRLRFLSKWYLKSIGFGFIFQDTDAPKIWEKKMDLEEEAKKVNNVFVTGCQELNYFDTQDYKIFTPREKIAKTIADISQYFTSNTIGVHIRSTDNEWSKENSPFQLFVEKMQHEMNKSKETNFFVATDNAAYQDKLLELFGIEKIIFHKKDFRRDTKKGIEDAVVDIFCLSKTTKIYGSFWSSFSEVAGRIGNIDVEVLKTKI